MLHYKPDLATQSQIEELSKILDPKTHPDIAKMTRLRASQLIQFHIANWRHCPATENQKRFLTSHGKWQDGMCKQEASDLIGSLISEFKKPKTERNKNE
jgi:hypothetical protein